MKSTFLNIDAGLIILRIGLGVTLIFFHGLPIMLGGSQRWKLTGYSLNYLGIYFSPGFWGFLAASFLIAGGILLITGWHYRLGILLILPVLLVAIIRESVNLGFSGALYPIELFWVLLGMLFINPGRATFIPRKIFT